MFDGYSEDRKCERYICVYLGENAIKSNLYDYFAKNLQNNIDNC